LGRDFFLLGFIWFFLLGFILLITINDLLKSYDKGKQIDMAILDFSKAFDTVPHKKLLHKLDQYGIRGPVHRWLTNFLTKRKMRVTLEIVQDSSAVRQLFVRLAGAVDHVKTLSIRKTVDLPLQHYISTFPRFVAIRFYFLSETLK
jgi:hypothetical protein